MEQERKQNYGLSLYGRLNPSLESTKQYVRMDDSTNCESPQSKYSYLVVEISLCSIIMNNGLHRIIE